MVGSQAVGLKFDKRSKYLFVCGGSTGEHSLPVAPSFTEENSRVVVSLLQNLMSESLLHCNGVYITFFRMEN